MLSKNTFQDKELLSKNFEKLILSETQIKEHEEPSLDSMEA